METNGKCTVRPFTSVVVPLDLTSASDRALPIVGKLARAADLEVVLVTTASRGLEETDRSDLLWRADQLEGCKVRTEVIPTNEPAVALTEFAHDRPASVVCLASHGRTAMGEVLFGSMTTEFLTRHAGPVLAIGPHIGEAFTTDLVVCVDDYTLGRPLLPTALAWRATFGADIRLLEVIEPSRLVRSSITTELRAASQVIPDADISMPTSGDPVTAILDAASTTQRVVVVANHDRRGLLRAVYGSVAHEVIRWSPTPVLVACN